MTPHHSLGGIFADLGRIFTIFSFKTLVLFVRKIKKYNFNKSIIDKSQIIPQNYLPSARQSSHQIFIARILRLSRRLPHNFNFIIHRQKIQQVAH